MSKVKKDKTNKRKYLCSLCEKIIAKYQLDLKCCEIKAKGEYKLICDSCAKLVAEYVVGEF